MSTPLIIEEEEDDDPEFSERVPNSYNYLQQSTSSALDFKTKASLLSQTDNQKSSDSKVQFVECSSDSPVAEFSSTGNDQDLEAEIDAAISTLHSVINKHFAHKAGMKTEEELFLLPEDIENFTLRQKAKLMRDLVEQAGYELLSTHAGAWAEFAATRKSDAAFPVRKRDDVVLRVFRLPPAGIHLSGEEVKQVAELLIGASRNIAATSMRKDLFHSQEQYNALASHLSDLRTSMFQRQEQMEAAEQTMAKLKAEGNTLKQQIVTLEQQLEDTMVESFVQEEKVKNLQAEVKFLAEEVMGNAEFQSKLAKADLTAYLTSGKEAPQTRVSRTSLAQTRARVAFNIGEDSVLKERSSTASRLSGQQLVTIIKRKPQNSLKSSLPLNPKK